MTVSRREVLGGLAATGLSFAKSAPVSTVAIARCRSYDDDLTGKLSRMFDQIGGVGQLVKGKTVALKLNLTGNRKRFPLDPALPYRSNPDTVLATAHLLARAGARRIRIIETFFPARQDMELWARYNLDIAAISNVGRKVEWENAQNLGKGQRPNAATLQALQDVYKAAVAQGLDVPAASRASLTAVGLQAS